MIEDTLQERGQNYGNFHTQANLTQTLVAIITQHYASTRKTEQKDATAVMPHFMQEAIHMICHKLARIANGNPYYPDSWTDISGYATLVVNILEQARAVSEEQVAKAKEQLEASEQKDGEA